MKLFILSYILLCIPYLVAVAAAMFQVQTVSIESRRYVSGFGDYPITLARLRVFMAVYTLGCSIIVQSSFGIDIHVFILFFLAMIVTIKDCIHYLSGKDGDIDYIRNKFIRMITVTEEPSPEQKAETRVFLSYGFPDGIRLRSCLVMAVMTPAILTLFLTLVSNWIYDFITY